MKNFTKIFIFLLFIVCAVFMFSITTYSVEISLGIKEYVVIMPEILPNELDDNGNRITNILPVIDFDIYSLELGEIGYFDGYIKYDIMNDLEIRGGVELYLTDFLDLKARLTIPIDFSLEDSEEDPYLMPELMLQPILFFDIVPNIYRFYLDFKSYFVLPVPSKTNWEDRAVFPITLNPYIKNELFFTDTTVLSVNVDAFLIFDGGVSIDGQREVSSDDFAFHIDIPIIFEFITDDNVEVELGIKIMNTDMFVVYEGDNYTDYYYLDLRPSLKVYWEVSPVFNVEFFFRMTIGLNSDYMSLIEEVIINYYPVEELKLTFMIGPDDDAKLAEPITSSGFVFEGLKFEVDAMLMASDYLDIGLDIYYVIMEDYDLNKLGFDFSVRYYFPVY